MSRETIRRSLSANLNTGVWRELKSALLGRELINFGTEVIYAVDLIRQELQNIFKLDPTRLDSIVANALIQEVSCDLMIPASLKIRIDLSIPRVFKPFQLRYTLGGSIYTNIDFVSSEEEVILYQGLVRTSRLNTGAIRPMMQFQTDYNENFENMLYTEYSQSVWYSHYLKLGNKVMSDSVRVFAASQGATINGNLIEGIFPLSEWDLATNSNEFYNYKVRTSDDGYQCLLFGNGVWGKKFQEDVSDYQVYWLDMTTLNVTPGSSGTLMYTAQGEELSGTLQYRIVSSQSYSVAVESIFNQVQRKIFRRVVPVKESQIRQFCNSYPSILDCSPVLTDTQEVTVFVKPTTQGDVYFSFLEDILMEFASSIVNYKVAAGESFDFSIALNTTEVLSQTTRDSIKSVLEDSFKYSEMDYKQVVSLPEIVTIIKNIVSYNVWADLIIRESLIVSDVMTLVTPIFKGTFKIEKDGEIIGWDSDGSVMLKSFAASSALGVLPDLMVGDFLINTKASGPGYMKSVSNTDNIQASLLNCMPDIVGLGYIYKQSTSKFILLNDNLKGKIWNMDKSFEEGEYSIQKLSNTVKVPYKSLQVISADIPDFNTNWSNVIFEGDNLYAFNLTGSTLLVTKYYLNHIDESNLSIKKYSGYGLSLDMSMGSNVELLKPFVVDNCIIIPFKESGANSEASSQRWVVVEEFKESLQKIHHITFEILGKTSFEVSEIFNSASDLWAFENKIVVYSGDKIVAFSKPQLLSDYTKLILTDSVSDVVTSLVPGRVDIYPLQAADYIWIKDNLLGECRKYKTNGTLPSTLLKTLTPFSYLRKITNIGTIDYVQNTVRIVSRLSELNGSILVYQPLTSTVLSSNNKYPKLNSVYWNG